MYAHNLKLSDCESDISFLRLLMMSIHVAPNAVQSWYHDAPGVFLRDINNVRYVWL